MGSREDVNEPRASEPAASRARPTGERRGAGGGALLALSVALLVVVVVLATAVGSVDAGLGELFAAAAKRLRGLALSPLETILWQIRLPRVLLAALVGGALGLAGAVFQGVFRNPLADPYLIGTASGAGFGATLAFALGGSWPILAQLGAPLVAFVVALASVLLVALLARDGTTLPTVRLILAGVVVGSIFTAATSFLLVASREQAAGILSWLLGGFGFASWREVAVVLGFSLPALLLAGAFARALDLLQLGEEGAALLGLPVEAIKYLMLGVATLLTAAAVSVAGIIGFVGLIIPHAVRLARGPAHAGLLPLAVVWGAGFMVLADLLARTVIAPVEIPVGVITALVGGPFFLLLLQRSNGAVSATTRPGGSDGTGSSRRAQRTRAAAGRRGRTEP